MTTGGESNGDPRGLDSRGSGWPRGCVGGLNQVPERGLQTKVGLQAPQVLKLYGGQRTKAEVPLCRSPQTHLTWLFSQQP